MPRFKVAGAHRDTGEEVTQIITAVSPADAETQARQRGLLVSVVVAVPEDPLASDGLPAPSASRNPAAALPYATPVPVTAQPIPDYFWAKHAAGIIVGFGLVTIALGILVLVSGIIQAAGNTPIERAAGLIICAYGLSLILSGVLLAAGGDLIRAIRDMARNSFK